MSDDVVTRGTVVEERSTRSRRPARLAICLCLLVALVGTACGGRADKDKGTTAAQAPSGEQPAAAQEPAAQDPAATAPTETPAADAGATTPPADANAAATPSGGGAKAATPGASSAAAPKSGGGSTPTTRSAAAKAPAGGSSGGGSPAAPKGGAPSVPAPGVPAPGGGGGGAAPSGPATGTPVHLGTICECSGPAGASIGPGIASNQLVVKWINDNGGLNGHPIKLFVGDSNSDPNRHFALVKQMVEENKVIAFIGMMAPLTINATDKYLRDKGIPVVGGDGAHGLWFGSPVLFFPGPSYTTQAVATAKLASALKTPKVAMFYCAEAQPCQLGRDALHSKLAKEKAPDVEIVYEAKVSLAQPDFSAECLQAKGKGAQAVIVFVDAAAASRTTRSCIQQAYRPQWLTSPLTSAHANDPNNEGMTNPVAVFPWFAEETPAQKLFHDAVRKYNPSLTVNATTSVVWVAGQMLKHASKNLPENPTSADIMKGMYTIKNMTFDGLLADPLTFTEGQNSPDHPCYFVVQIKKGAYTAPYGSKPQCL
ncbi:MAG: ABC transporter substrate-binding protein [Actinomycetota bacterium]